MDGQFQRDDDRGSIPALKIRPAVSQGAVSQWRGFWRAALLMTLLLFIWECSMPTKTLLIKDTSLRFTAGTIIHAQQARAVTFEALLADVVSAEVIYLGETHTSKRDHDIQLKVIRSVFEKNPDVVVAMEMFDRTYQAVLDKWSAGELTEAEFLKKTHWYANWRYNYDLYRDILAYVKEHRIPLVGLNIPFHIPSKIAVGGLENLSDADRMHIPRTLDTSNPDHRAYVEEVFKRHRFKGRDDFESFYQAQCAWEDAMAEVVAAQPDDKRVIVLAGNGHIIQKFGIPNRAYGRNPRPFRTIYPTPVGTRAELRDADYIWVTSPEQSM